MSEWYKPSCFALEHLHQFHSRAWGAGNPGGGTQGVSFLHPSPVGFFLLGLEAAQAEQLAQCWKTSSKDRVAPTSKALLIKIRK